MAENNENEQHITQAIEQTHTAEAASHQQVNALNLSLVHFGARLAEATEVKRAVLTGRVRGILKKRLWSEFEADEFIEYGMQLEQIRLCKRNVRVATNVDSSRKPTTDSQTPST